MSNPLPRGDWREGPSADFPYTLITPSLYEGHRLVVAHSRKWFRSMNAVQQYAEQTFSPPFTYVVVRAEQMITSQMAVVVFTLPPGEV